MYVLTLTSDRESSADLYSLQSYCLDAFTVVVVGDNLRVDCVLNMADSTLVLFSHVASNRSPLELFLDKDLL